MKMPVKNILKAGIGVGAAMAILAVATIDRNPQVIQQISQQPVERKVAAKKYYEPLGIVEMVFSSYKLQESTSDAVKSHLEKNIGPAVQQVYDQFAAQGYPKIPDGLSELTIEAVTKEYVPATGSLEGRVEQARKSIEHVRAFLANAIELPPVEFAIPKTPAEAKASIEKARQPNEPVKLNLVHGTKYNLTLTGEVKYGARIVPFQLKAEAIDYGSAFHSAYDFVYLPENSQFEFQYYHISWSQNNSPQNIFETPALEVLHAATVSIQAKYLEFLGKQARNDEELAKATNRGKLLDEYVVHGIGRMWLKGINEEWKLGYDMEQLVREGKTSTWWSDENVTKMEKFAEQHGPAKVIELYRSSPETLIKEAGLKF